MIVTASPTDLNSRKALGRAYLEANRVEEALKVYAKILRDYPDDVDAYLFLGDCYMGEDDPETALLLYSHALEHANHDPHVHRRIQFARSECAMRHQQQPVNIDLELLHKNNIPSDPKVLTGLLNNLAGIESQITEDDVLKAAQLLEDIVNSPTPAQVVAERMAEIDALVPALLLLNIRQAKMDGRPDLATALENLLDNINLQKGDLVEQPVVTYSPPVAEVRSTATDLRVLFVGTPQDSKYIQQEAFVSALRELNSNPVFATEFPFDEIQKYDAIVALNPHLDLTVMEGLAATMAVKKPVILYLDMDYEQMPVDYPDYDLMGLSTLARSRAYSAALLLADRICVPSQTFAATLQSRGHNAVVISDGWSADADLWAKAPLSRTTLHLGWVGKPGEVEDVFQARRMIIRVMREFPQLRLVICGDTEVYQLFDSLADTRKVFLPADSLDDVSYVMSQIDILLVPLRNSPFNRSISDRRVFEAGLRGIPWVASPLPSYAEYKTGGLIVNSSDEWHTHLRQLILDSNFRNSLGWSGNAFARMRDSHYQAKLWNDLLHKVIDSYHKNNGRIFTR